MLLVPVEFVIFFLFFFNDTATTEIYTLSLHDALPICMDVGVHVHRAFEGTCLQSYTASGRVPIFSGGLPIFFRSEEHTSELQSQSNLVCRLLLEKKKRSPRPDSSRTPVRSADARADSS